MKHTILALAAALLATLSARAAQPKLTPVLQQRLQSADPGAPLHCWVTFADKGSDPAYPRLDPRALARRARTGRRLSSGDLPVAPQYLDALRDAGAVIRTVSPWLNAASVSADRAAITAIAALPGVVSVDLVAVFRAPSEGRGAAQPAKEVPALDYGLSQDQVKLLRIDELHRMGYTGSGVRVALLDNGFDREHEALQRVRIIAERDFQRLVHPRDQYGDTIPGIWRPDSITSFEPDQDSSRVQTQHGTAMLSLIGGYKPGSLIGAAYNADFILGKTELTHRTSDPDYYREEDYWIAGLQWAADTAGADIVSSSLGYRQFTDHPSYSYAQMDGNTARATRAADSAASRGVLVVNAIGNWSGGLTNPDYRPDTLIAVPSDGDSVLTVGGVDNGRAWVNTKTGSGAACGPAADSVPAPGGTYIRRIKPDVAAGWQAYCASNDSSATGGYNLYYYGAGTSGATAMTAGLCALLLEAHPHWGAPDIIAALRASGSNRGTVAALLAHPESLSTALGAAPNYNQAFAAIATGHKYCATSGGVVDLYDAYRVGWGVPDGVAAVNVTPPEVTLPSADALLDPYPNPAAASAAGVYFPYFLSRDSYQVTLRIFTLDGRLVRQIEQGQQLAGQYPGMLDRVKHRTGGNAAAYWDLKDAANRPVPGGIYLALLTTGWNQTSKKVVVLR